jgi:glycosyltransferase involved in cell wall biosynthesis
MRPGLVSVIIPTFNHGPYVVDAVTSALAQTYRHTEIIVIDDGSTDDTARQLQPFADRIHYVYQPNHGLSAARNAGVRLAKGDWIALLDADDVWHKEKLDVDVQALRSLDRVHLIGSPGTACLPDALEPFAPVRHLEVRDFMVSSKMGTTGALIHRECFETVGLFDEQLTAVEDRDMWLRISARFKCAQILSRCWWYRPHAGQMSLHAQRMHDNYKRVLVKFFEQHPEYADLGNLAWSYLFFDSAWAYLNEGDRSAARMHMMKSLRLRPFSLGDRNARSFVRARAMVRLLVGDTWFHRVTSIPRRAW